ncbi:hypothetical protein RJT34_02413 [Clitoria ternatea]|uniref:Uncharacterized protein n=1 Tax=Clitoria ternatea TaxID=43366 RepID=A0AAN9KKD6_CLITE
MVLRATMCYIMAAVIPRTTGDTYSSKATPHKGQPHAAPCRTTWAARDLHTESREIQIAHAQSRPPTRPTGGIPPNSNTGSYAVCHGCKCQSYAFLTLCILYMPLINIIINSITNVTTRFLVDSLLLVILVSLNLCVAFSIVSFISFNFIINTKTSTILYQT